MSFIHPVLLGGIVLVGLPVLLHLIMRQQPKHLLFPAFRFLKLQVRTNQRKLRLRHLLLLLLRMLLIALMCLALARPRLFSDRFGGLGAEQSAAVALVIDTSRSMEYTVAGKPRLEEAKARALELLDELGPSSRVAVLDTNEAGGEWAASVGAARERISKLDFHDANRPVTDALDAAFALFGRAESEESGPAAEALARFVYVFSDRTPASWENSRLADLKQRRDRLPEPRPKCVYIDVGVEQPADLAIADVRLRSQVVAANQSVFLEVTVQTTGEARENDVICRFDGDTKLSESKPVKPMPGRQVITFERAGLGDGFHQAEVTLGADDSLPSDNRRFVTVEVRKPRKVLVLCDQPADAELWRKAVNNQGLYECDVKSDGEIAKLGPGDLAAYRTVCLVSYNPGQFGREIWEKLHEYVTKGGGVVVAPSAEADPDDYNNSSAQQILPATLVKLESSKPGVELTDFLAQHQVLARYYEQYTHLPLRAYQFWEVKPADDATPLIRYKDAKKSPALLERVSAQSQGRGKVMMFTTPMDERRDAAGNPPNDFNSDWFYFVFVNEAVRYLAGEIEETNLNYLAGGPVLIPLPLDRRFPTYTLQGGGLTGADTAVTRPENANELRLTRPQSAGQYTLTGGNREWTTQFSVNVPPDEWDLAPRVGADVIEDLFGPDALVAVGQDRKLRDALEGQLRQPVELFPWLMILLLFVLAVENLLANRFYRQAPGGS